MIDSGNLVIIKKYLQVYSVRMVEICSQQLPKYI